MSMHAVASLMHAVESFARAAGAAHRAWKGPAYEYKDVPVLLKDVRLVDVEEERTRAEPSDIKLENGRISLVAPAGELDSRGLKVLEGRNRFALPGLIDCHVHICGIFITALPGISDFRWLLRQVYLNHRAQLQSGVTLVRDMMSVLRVSLLFKSLAEDACSGFPRVLCAGPMLTVEGGYPPYVPRDQFYQRVLGGPLKLELAGERDAVSWVDRLAGAGVDWIKIGYQGALFDMARTPLSKPSARLFRAIADRAHHHGLPVAVHHYWLQDLKELLELPFDTLEHITEDGEIDARTLARMAERGLPVTSDLEQSAFAHEPQKFLHMIEEGKSNLLPRPRGDITRLLHEVAAGQDIYGLKPRRKIMDLAFVRDLVFQKMRNLKLLADSGILIGAASDAGVHMMMGILPEELCRMTEAGLSNAQALRSATIDAARLLRVDDVGRIKAGYRGDIVLYENDPLENIAAVRSPALVMRDGVPHTPLDR
ncbi:MAG: hypothetical protein C4536_03265 [Actinobacteria bacterium]|jgi:imidazolonepropionase-like amidohydrolase|nr:MAG: hypothetical protein C4536_03265 [Actinomycetota bacterium]